MANQIFKFQYRSFHINKRQTLGHGSYGAVYKAKCDQLPCAAKILHPTILDPNDPGAAKIMQRFQQEYAYLESIRHPNIVQYLGMTRDPESRLPVLLMELLDESLTKMLEHSQRSLQMQPKSNRPTTLYCSKSRNFSNDRVSINNSLKNRRKSQQISSKPTAPYRDR
jgi:serine/threonine protein kinase